MMKELQTQSSSTSLSFSAKASITILVAGALFFTVSIPAGAQRDKSPTYSVLHAFTGGEDGALPAHRVVIDREGNLFSSTATGGYFGGEQSPCHQSGCGVVFKLDRAHRESVVYAFAGPPEDLSGPGEVIRDEEGNFYGAAGNTIFKISPWGHETQLYTFTGGADGGSPAGPLIRDHEGNLYGTTSDGGIVPGCGGFETSPLGCGVVFKIDPRGRETALYSFTGGADGGVPGSGLIRDEEGNLYGTTYNGGTVNVSLGCGTGCGVIFKIDRHGKETVLHTFAGGSGGLRPEGIARSRDGSLYGVTIQGGNPLGLGYGLVYKLDARGEFTVLHAFADGPDGASPFGTPLLIGKDLYGTTSAGGNASTAVAGPFGAGVIYKIDTATGKETALYTFNGLADGWEPFAQLTRDEEGNFYGTAVQGGNFSAPYCVDNGCGVVFKLTLHDKCDDDHRDRDRD